MGQSGSKAESVARKHQKNLCFYDLMPIGVSEYRKSFEESSEVEVDARTIRDNTRSFLLDVTSHLVKHVHANNNRSEKVLEFNHPRLLLERLEKVLFLEEEEPQNLPAVLKGCRQVLKYCVRTGHPRFFNQISQGLDIIGLVGEWATSATNISLSDKDAWIYRRMESIVLLKMRKYLGWDEGDGILTPGGTMSNLYSVAVARHKMFQNFKHDGLSQSTPIVLFTSDQSHFSIKRAGVLLGVGSDHVVPISSDERGKMSTRDLRLKIEESLASGMKPFLVAATSGTTVLGAFDRLDEIADLCQEFDLWLHVDAAWGGGLLLSRTHRHLLHGIHRANSVTWNPHKLMGVPLQCSAFFVKENGLLEECFSLEDEVGFFPGDEFVDNRTMEGTRHNDVLKLWLIWKAKGCRSFEKQIDDLMKLSRYMQGEINVRPGFEFVLREPEYLNICFWYVPQKLREIPNGRERDDKLSAVASKVKAVMMEKGQTMVGYQPLGTKPNFFRMIISNPATSEQDVDFLLDQIQLYGEL